MKILGAKLGKAEDFRYCYDYLKTKPKWSSFANAQEVAELKHDRPVGKKKEKKNLAERAACVSALKEFRDSQQPTVTEETKLLSSSSTSFETYVTAQKEEAVIALMDTPDRKEVMTMKKKVLIAKYQKELDDLDGDSKNKKQKVVEDHTKLFEEF